MLHHVAMVSIHKCSLILDFNILQSVHWLHVRMIWGVLKIPMSRQLPKLIKSESLVLGISTFLKSLDDSNVWPRMRTTIKIYY